MDLFRASITAAAILALCTPGLALATDNHYSSNQDYYDNAKTANTILRAAKLCPQYQFDEALFKAVLKFATTKIGIEQVAKAIDESNGNITAIIALGAKDKFCDAAEAQASALEDVFNLSTGRKPPGE